MKHIVIIGNGISGITCARNIRKNSDYRITVISAESEHFFSRTALMYVYMGHMKYEHIKPYEDWFWEKNRIELLHTTVNRIDFSSKQIYCNKDVITYDDLVIAVGSKSNKFGWPGQDLKGVQGLYSLQDLEHMNAHTANAKKAVVIGGGLIGIEMAEMLASRNISVTYLVRESNFWSNILPEEEAKMIAHHIKEHGIDLQLEEELKEIIGDENGCVTKVITKSGKSIDADFVGLAVGVSPNISFLQNTELETDRGVLVNEYFETNMQDVYSIGDCAQFKNPLTGRKPLEQVWYTGKIHGETLANTLCGTRTSYKPGHWYNSAKFFDIEYQTYGIVPNQLDDSQQWFCWVSTDSNKLVRIVFDNKNGIVQGFNIMGIRFRHEVCDQWLREERSIDYVMEHLSEANFDPEFYKQNEGDILNTYNLMYGKSLMLKSKKGLFSAFFN